MTRRFRLVAASLVGWALMAGCGSDDDGPTNPPPVVPGGPTATITGPVSGSSYTAGQRIEFRGMATDDEDGMLGDDALAWTSSRDGAIGTGSSFDYNGLSEGTHTVTLTATDSDGLRGTAQITVTVNAVPVLPPVPPGAVILQDDMDDENNGQATTNYTGFENWNVTRQCVDLHGPGSIDPVPGNGLYIDMDGSCNVAGRMESKQNYALDPGTYRFEMVLAGNNQNGPTDTMDITIGSLFSTTLVVPEDESFNIREWTFNVPAATTATIVMDHAGGDQQGILIDAIRLSRD
ncbi:MAG: hypothetical protein M8840_01360 [marine benthic group bacterium]|jgi:hypothetical protein|nr:hypothetical protein [Gemmatimonadota bacterium]MCL7989755.1 hypothetical protein [Gemmatimonadota bacterium]